MICPQMMKLSFYHWLIQGVMTPFLNTTQAFSFFESGYPGL